MHPLPKLKFLATAWTALTATLSFSHYSQENSTQNYNTTNEKYFFKNAIRCQ